MTVELAAPLVLASASPRRKALLEFLGIPFSVVPSQFDERSLSVERPSKYARRAATLKTRDVMRRVAVDCAVLGADTVVAIGDKTLGKPVDDTEALSMLSALSGRTHQVWTSVCLGRANEVIEAQVVSTDVTFRKISEQEVSRYVATGEGCDKAGAYAIQGDGARFVRAIAGSYSNVVGLPVVETLSLLRRHGVLLSWP